MFNIDVFKTDSTAFDIVASLAFGPFYASDIACEELHEYGRRSIHALWTYPVSIIILSANIAMQPIISTVVIIAGAFFGIIGSLTCSAEWLEICFSTIRMGAFSFVLNPALLALRIFNSGCMHNGHDYYDDSDDDSRTPTLVTMLHSNHPVHQDDSNDDDFQEEERVKEQERIAENFIGPSVKPYQLPSQIQALIPKRGHQLHEMYTEEKK